jgi:hypothetical protein
VSGVIRQTRIREAGSRNGEKQGAAERNREQIHVSAVIRRTRIREEQGGTGKAYV